MRIPYLLVRGVPGHPLGIEPHHFETLLRGSSSFDTALLRMRLRDAPSGVLILRDAAFGRSSG
jgi:hypothetical protein